MNQRQITKQEFIRKKRLKLKKVTVQKDDASQKVTTFIAQSSAGATINVPDAATSINNLYQVSEKLTDNYNKQFCIYVLQMGCLLNHLKIQVKTQKLGNWGLWSATNIKGPSARTKQAWMQLAKIDGVWSYTHLGYSALSIILSKINPLYNQKHHSKKFHLFFSESSYPLTVYNDIEEVKKLIAVHVFEVKAKRDALVCDIQKLKDLSVYKGVLNDSLREDLLNAFADGGDEAVSNRLDRYIMGRGRLPRQSTIYKSKSKKLALDRIKHKIVDILGHYRRNNQSLGEIKLEDIEVLSIVIDELHHDKFAFDLVEEIVK